MKRKKSYKFTAKAFPSRWSFL